MKAKGATLVERGAVEVGLSDYEAVEVGPFEQLLVLRIVGKIGLDYAWSPIVVTHLAEEFQTSRQKLRRGIEVISKEGLLEFEVKGNAESRGRRVNRARPSRWLIDRVHEVIGEEENE